MNYKIIFFLTVCFVAVTGQQRSKNFCGSAAEFRGFIVGGRVTEPQKWPWLAALYYVPDNKFFCAGTLISDRHVVTGKKVFQAERSRNNSESALSFTLHSAKRRTSTNCGEGHLCAPGQVRLVKKRKRHKDGSSPESSHASGIQSDYHELRRRHRAYLLPKQSGVHLAFLANLSDEHRKQQHGWICRRK